MLRRHHRIESLVPIVKLPLVVASLLVSCSSTASLTAGSEPTRARHGMVVSQSGLASEIGTEILRSGGSAVDAAVATAFALAVTHPAAGNIGGGGFLVWRSAKGDAGTYDFREMAPAAATETMWLVDGAYDRQRHHESHLSVGVPGTVAGLWLAWRDHGRLSWRRLVEPALLLAEEGFEVSHGLERSLGWALPRFERYPASRATFSKDGVPYRAGDTLRQPDLASTLRRIAAAGPDGFYRGETADLIAREMELHGGLITRDDLEAYRAIRRAPIRASYRGREVISMPPPSSGGVALVQMLQVLEGFDLRAAGFGSARTLHLYAEAMRRAFADRALHLGDPDRNPDMPVERLISRGYAAELRTSIRLDRASVSTPSTFTWPRESTETTHLSVVDADRNAVSLTYTLEAAYGSGIVVDGAGFLLNNEMGDFNPVPGETNAKGRIGTAPNLTAAGKRMLSSMTPTIVLENDDILLVTGSPGGRTIINTVLQTVVNTIDFRMNAQEAVDAGRVHHQWLPDRLLYEPFSVSPDTLRILRELGHRVHRGGSQGSAQVIRWNAQDELWEGGSDRRREDAAAIGY